jgi:hypothetical protein
MAKQFSSRLIFANDIPTKNASVFVFDGDPTKPGAIDVTIGACTTDATGRFSVEYQEPDKAAYLQFRYVARAHDGSYSRSVRRAPTEIRLPEYEWLEFTPSDYGFKFPNNFPPFDLPDSLPKIPNLPMVSENYGLCGGMSSAAYDFYLAGRQPAAMTVPEAGSPLHKYLFKRALNTFGFLGENLLKVGRWTLMPDGEANGTQRQSRLEWENIKGEMDAEKAVVITLIYKSARSAKELFNVIWDNHQVLAYGYTPRTDGMIDIHIYDSNYPGVNDAIVQARRVFINTSQGILEGLDCQEIIPGRGTVKVRGFFAMDYEKESPPEDAE